MSLDVYLYDDTVPLPEPERCMCRCGHEHMTPTYREAVFSANVTHNLGTMAGAAGIYLALWRPDEMDPPLTKASELVPYLEAGLAAMERDPAKFIAHNPENGWGSYERFVPWVRDYLDACRKWPHARVEVSR